jgi:hypothetical protein
MSNFVRTVDMDDEARETLKGFLTTLDLQMATIAELKECHALTPSARPSTTGSTPSGMKGGSPSDCHAAQAQPV